VAQDVDLPNDTDYWVDIPENNYPCCAPAVNLRNLQWAIRCAISKSRVRSLQVSDTNQRLPEPNPNLDPNTNLKLRNIRHIYR